MIRWAAVAAGSAAGGLCRYLLGGLMTKRFGAAFPWGTLAINVLGCLAIGWTAGRGERLSEETRLLLATGFCGGFTTFSAFAGELSSLGGTSAAVYAAASLAGALAAFRAGLMLGR